MKKFVFVLMLATCAVAGCSTQKSEATKGSGTDAKAEIIAASKKLIALKSLAATVEGEGPLGLRKDVKYEAPDRYQISFDDENGAHVEMITVGNESFIKDGEKWNKMPGEDPLIPSFRNSFLVEVLETMTDPKFEGEESLHGKPTKVYSYRLVTKIGSFRVFRKIWVDKASGVPLQSVAEYIDSKEKNLVTIFNPDAQVAIAMPTTGAAPAANTSASSGSTAAPEKKSAEPAKK